MWGRGEGFISILFCDRNTRMSRERERRAWKRSIWDGYRTKTPLFVQWVSPESTMCVFSCAQVCCIWCRHFQNHLIMFLDSILGLTGMLELEGKCLLFFFFFSIWSHLRSRVQVWTTGDCFMAGWALDSHAWILTAFLRLQKSGFSCFTDNRVPQLDVVAVYPMNYCMWLMIQDF